MRSVTRKVLAVPVLLLASNEGRLATLNMFISSDAISAGKPSDFSGWGGDAWRARLALPLAPRTCFCCTGRRPHRVGGRPSSDSAGAAVPLPTWPLAGLGHFLGARSTAERCPLSKS